MRKFCLILLGIVVISLPVLGGPNAMIAISVWAAAQPGAPLQVVGFRKGSRGTRSVVEVIVKNSGDRAIASFRIQAAVRNPCGSADEPTWYRGSALNKIAINPNSSAQANEQVADTTVIEDAKRLRAPYLHVQVGVTEVTFQDGEIWKYKFPDEGGLFAPSQMRPDQTACSKWSTPGSIFKELTGNLTIVKDSASGMLSIRPDGYLLTCAVKGGKVFCPTF